MDNRCFIIMPPAEPSGYPAGHFNRVYEYVIVPACRAAGYWPAKSDAATHDDPLENVKNMIDSEIALVDLSANNSNALYGLAVRRALDLPVVVTKDMKTFVMFDAKEFGLVEYDESLRIDTVQKAIEVLGEALKKAVETKKGRHPLLDRLSIGLPPVLPSPVIEAESISAPAIEEPGPEEAPKSKEPRLPKISPLPDYVGDSFTEEELAKLKAGDLLFHLNHGKGTVNFVKKDVGKDKLASIHFDSGTKLLMLAVSDFFRKVNK